MLPSKSEGSQRMRLNVSVLSGKEAIAKFLVVVDAESGLEHLISKVERNLRQLGINTRIERLLNAFEAALPSDEFLGDMLRDGEEIYAFVGPDGQVPSSASALRVPVPQRPPSFLTEPAFSARRAQPPAAIAQERVGDGPGLPGIAGCAVEVPAFATTFTGASMPVKATVTLPAQLVNPESSEEEEEDEEEDEDLPHRQYGSKAKPSEYPPFPVVPAGAPAGTRGIPGPQEELTAERMPWDVMQVDHPCDPVPINTYDNDWLVENLTPKLREFILANFQGDLITEPKYVASIGKYVGARFLQASGSFVSVFMRPQTALGSDRNATMPVHYYIAKADIQNFQRQVEGRIHKHQQHLETFGASLRGLKALLAKGMQENDVVDVILPQSFRAFEEVEGLMMEVERPMLPMKGTGSCPVIIVDTSAAVGRHLPYVKAALKRALYGSVAGKARFQMIRFTPATGEPRLFAKTMMEPDETALQGAEDWIDALRPVTSSRLASAIRFALSFQECDEIYILSSAEFDKSKPDAVISEVRALNRREVAIHTVGVEPDAAGELLLRNLAESNHGDFLLKTFQDGKGNAISAHDSKFASWRTTLVNERTKQLSDNFKKQRMSIGSQIKIVEVMQREEHRKEVFWSEEWQCANRLLTSQEDPKLSVPDRDMLRELQRKSSRTLAARVGGGFLYQTGEPDLGLERMFEHKSSVPWTNFSDTVAVGPKMPLVESIQARIPKLPPSSEMMALAPSQDGDSRSSRPGCSSGSKMQKKLPALVPVRPSSPGNPWAGMAGSMDRTRRPPSARRGGSSSARTASADRAAGGRASSPAHGRSPARKSRSKTPPPSRPETGRGMSPAGGRPMLQALPVGTAAGPAPPQPMTPPGLERRWSF